MNQILDLSHPFFCLPTDLPPVGSRLEDRLLPFGFEVKFPRVCQNDLSPEGIWGLELVDEMLLGPRFGSCSRLEGRLHSPKRAADLLLLASASQSLSNILIGS